MATSLATLVPRAIASRVPKRARVVRRLRRTVESGQHGYHSALSHASAIAPGGTAGALGALAERFPLTPEHVLLAYAQGLFPMDEAGRVRWRSPDPRCVIPLDALHVPSRVARYIRNGGFELGFDADPSGVLAACGDRPVTWLTPRLQAAYRGVYDLGALHTVEARREGRLVGGAFGIAVGTVFTVESMFTHEDHAGKVAFAFLAQHLAGRGFTLVDCQYAQPHTAAFGAIEIPRDEYRRHLARGLARPAAF